MLEELVGRLRRAPPQDRQGDAHGGRAGVVPGVAELLDASALPRSGRVEEGALAAA